MQNANCVLSGKVQAQLALVAAAVAGTVAGNQSADAALVTTFASTTIVVPQTSAGIYLNLLTGVAGTSASGTAGWDFNPYLTATGLGFYWNQTAVGGATAGGVTATSTGITYSDLTPGTVVGPGSFFTNAIQGTSASFRTTGTHVLGFRFVNELTSAINYGYLTMTTSTGSTTATAGYPATINGWQFDNAGAAVTVPVVPEPTGAAFAALASGAMLLRNRRKVA